VIEPKDIRPLTDEIAKRTAELLLEELQHLQVQPRLLTWEQAAAYLAKYEKGGKKPSKTALNQMKDRMPKYCYTKLGGTPTSPVAFDRLGLDRWIDETKEREGKMSEEPVLQS
jgi:hypothetical protein